MGDRDDQAQRRARERLAAEGRDHGLGHRRVQGPALLLAHRRVDQLLELVLGEGQAAVFPLEQDALLVEGLEAVEEGLVLQADGLAQELEVEGAADHGGGMGDRPRRGRQALEVRHQEAPEVVGQPLRREVDGGVPAALAHGQEPLLHQVLEQPLDVEGVAARELVHLAAEGPVQRLGAEHGRDHAARLLGRQVFHGQQRRALVFLGLARGQQKEDRRAVQVAPEVIEQLRRERIRPLPVLEHHDEGLLGGEGREQGRVGRLQAQLLLLRRIEVGRRLRLDLGQELDQHRPEAIELLGHQGLEARQERSQGPDQGAVGDRPLLVGLADGAWQALELHPEAELLDQAALADAGRPREQERSAGLAAGDARQVLRQLLHERLAAHERRDQELAADARRRLDAEVDQHLEGRLVAGGGLFRQQLEHDPLVVGMEALDPL